MITGYYHRYGYTIESDLPNGEHTEIHSAGNSPNDSSARISTRNPCVSLDTLEEWCRRSVRQAAEQRGEEAGGVSFDEDWDEEYSGHFGDGDGKCPICRTHFQFGCEFCAECGERLLPDPETAGIKRFQAKE